jgi:hypothetical protein
MALKFNNVFACKRVWGLKIQDHTLIKDGIP